MVHNIEDKMLHWWAGESDQYEIGSDEWVEVVIRGDGTCMLPFDHEGPHIFTPDSKIEVCFVEE